MNMVEKVARAIAEKSGWDGWDTAKTASDTLSGNDPEDEREACRVLARAAIEAYEAAKKTVDDFQVADTCAIPAAARPLKRSPTD